MQKLVIHAYARGDMSYSNCYRQLTSDKGSFYSGRRPLPTLYEVGIAQGGQTWGITTPQTKALKGVFKNIETGSQPEQCVFRITDPGLLPLRRIAPVKMTFQAIKNRSLPVEAISTAVARRWGCPYVELQQLSI